HGERSCGPLLLRGRLGADAAARGWMRSAGADAGAVLALPAPRGRRRLLPRALRAPSGDSDSRAAVCPGRPGSDGSTGRLAPAMGRGLRLGRPSLMRDLLTRASTSLVSRLGLSTSTRRDSVATLTGISAPDWRRIAAAFPELPPEPGPLAARRRERLRRL